VSLLAKVCGLTTAADARHALACGADLLGFVVHPPSPRHCARVAEACAPAPDRAVLVMVGDDADAMMQAARAAGIRRIQPHASEAGRGEVVAKLRAAGFFILLPWADRPGQAVIDADLYLWEPDPAATGVAGGSGQAHAMAFPPPGPFLLAGGLDASNLADRHRAIPAAARADLRGFDAASRLEAAPGTKDPAKVRAFVAAAHELRKD
jgi:phosphoribosylanthranilate isomerase